MEILISKKNTTLFRHIFLIFIFILPLFGKYFDSTESIFFYSLPPLFLASYCLLSDSPLTLPRRLILPLSLLFLFFLTTTINSSNPGASYYALFTTLTLSIIWLLAINFIPTAKFNLGLIIAASIYSLILILNVCHILPLPIKDSGDNFILQVWGHSYLSDFLLLALLPLFNKLTSTNFKKIFPLLIFLLFALLLTKSRSTMIAFLFGLLLLRPVNKLQALLKRYLYFFTTVSLLILFALIATGQISQKNLTGSREIYWSQAIHGFLQSPWLGNGPSTFPYVSRLYQTTPQVFANSPHNSILGILSDLGLPATLIILWLLSMGLMAASRYNNLYFALGLASFLNSLTDPSWSSSGILLLSLYLIFKPLYLDKKNPHIKIKTSILWLLVVLLSLCQFAYNFSNITYIKGKYTISAKLNPINPLPKVKIVETNSGLEKTKATKSLLALYPNDIDVYKSLANVMILPENETYYYKIFQLQPKDNLDQYLKLMDYYNQTYQYDKLYRLIQLFSQNFPTSEMKDFSSIPVSKALYEYGLKYWYTNRDLTILCFENAVKFSNQYSYFYIELANAYWTNNQHEKAINQLAETCQQYELPKNHCEDYLVNVKFTTPGSSSLQKLIQKL